MKKPLTVHPHLSVEAVEMRYRTAKDPVERERVADHLVAGGGARPPKRFEKSPATAWPGFAPSLIAIIKTGLQELATVVRAMKAGSFILSAPLRAQLVAALEEPPPDGGLWTGRKVAQWILAPTSRQVHPKPGWEYLKAWARASACCVLGRPKPTQPRRRHSKKLPEQVNALEQAFPQATVELWTTDQHRVGLGPILRRIWVRKGSRPRGSRHQRYQWLYLYTFVQPATGKTEWFVLPTVTAEVFTIALFHFAQAVGAGPTRRILLVLDRAGWHTNQELVVPEGIHLLFLPPYSPELQRMSNACGH